MRPWTVACEVFRDEILAAAGADLACRFLPQGYHRTPGKMPPLIQAEIDQAPSGADAVVLVYGLCSNGVVGLRAPATAPLVLPKVHDCIAMLMGSREAYEREATRCPGSYYLTRGWIEYGQNPYSQYRGEYRQKYDEETAAWIARELMKHYRRMVLIDHGLGGVERYRAYTREAAAFFGVAYEELAGSLDYLRRLLGGPWDGDDFLVIPPGETVEQAPFLCLDAVCQP